MTIIVWIFVASDLFNWKFEVLHIPTLQCVEPRETEGNRSKDPCFHPSMMAKVSRDHRRVGINEKRTWLLYVFGLNHALYYIESSKFQVQLVFFSRAVFKLRKRFSWMLDDVLLVGVSLYCYQFQTPNKKWMITCQELLMLVWYDESFLPHRGFLQYCVILIR